MSQTEISFREVNRDIFEAIRDGRKRVETRAATDKYLAIRLGDLVVFSCGNDSFVRRVKLTRHFHSVEELLQQYRPEEINPKTRTMNELNELYMSFPGYPEMLERAGLVAIEI